MKVEKFVFKPLTGDVLVGRKGDDDVPFLAKVVKSEVEEQKKEEPKKEESIYKYTKEDIDASRAAGYEEGYARGYEAAKAKSEENEQSILKSLEIISANVNQVMKKEEAIHERKFKDIAQVVINLAKKVSGVAIQNNPVAEIEDALRKSFEVLFDKPKLLIVVNDSLIDEVKKRVYRLGKEVNFSGDIEITGDAKVAKGECSVSWQGGGMKLEKENMWKEIDEICKNIL